VEKIKGRIIIGAPHAGVQILQKITLSPDGNSYSGVHSARIRHFRKRYASFTGVISAKRITPGHSLQGSALRKGWLNFSGRLAIFHSAQNLLE
jgi:hypothetical protein